MQRATTIIAYVLMVLCGTTLPFQIAQQPGAFDGYWLTLSVFLFVGGASSVYGQLRHNWIGEFIGLPLCSTALASFGVLQAGEVGWDPTLAIPSTSLLWAIAALTFSRWRDVWALYRAATRRKP